jgi:hypothetical protein
MDTISNFLYSMGLGDSAVLWFTFFLAAIRGLAATTAEMIPNSKLGKLQPLIDAIGGNNRNASGSQ